MSQAGARMLTSAYHVWTWPRGSSPGGPCAQMSSSVAPSFRAIPLQH